MQAYIIDRDSLHPRYPTHFHSNEFWQELGRTVAAFGFLEDTLGKAIFAITATTKYPEDKAQAAYDKWSNTLEICLTGQLGNLIEKYQKAVKENTNSTIMNIEELVSSLTKAAELRNVICHASWDNRPDANGATIPRYFRKRDTKRFDGPINASYLIKIQQEVRHLICDVTDSVTTMGFTFPGTIGPGKPVW